MISLVFLLEEPSAKVMLKLFLPRILPDDVSFFCIPHEGKQDLEKSIRNKLQNWTVPNTWFVVIRDKDQGDCAPLEQSLQALCEAGGRPETLIRIAVHELESWFLGDLAAIGQAYALPKLANKQNSKKFRNPDALANAKEEIGKLVKGYQKMAGARAIAPHLALTGNTSVSFRHLICGLEKYVIQIRPQVS
ncbi:DUF4276 family protein [Pelagibaculum spongiae]|uniref:DUF4276 domain-containing protein n=1 Tax=Pelagibaculum spongiae TaxID=2080658 RepID=A0A2V1GQ49_9GAMM|nr:DUF4276 family protein [Pelagibaculum spongiae]PVZ65659.1 hypothetical protein DC094_17385 [Pelagibaculum spongiae]